MISNLYPSLSLPLAMRVRQGSGRYGRTFNCQMIWSTASNSLSHLTDITAVTDILIKERERACLSATTPCLDIFRGVMEAAHDIWVFVTVGNKDCGRNEALQSRR